MKARTIIEGLLSLVGDLTDQQAMPDALPEYGEVLTAARAFVGQPVSVGDTITLRALWPKPEERCEPSSDLGFTFVPYVERHREYDFDKREYTGKVAEYQGQHTLYPEAGPARSYTWEELGAGVVVPINGIRYRIHITVGGSDHFGSPDGAVVTFTRTEDEETPGKPFDRAVAAQRLIDHLEDRIHEAREEIAGIESGEREESEWFTRGHQETEILDAELRIHNLRSGAERLCGVGPVILFGQPQFIQNEITPRTQHEAGRHLATLETGWGDSGNVNILFACDEDGLPCRAWFEASCC